METRVFITEHMLISFRSICGLEAQFSHPMLVEELLVKRV